MSAPSGVVTLPAELQASCDDNGSGESDAGGVGFAAMLPTSKPTDSTLQSLGGMVRVGEVYSVPSPRGDGISLLDHIKGSRGVRTPAFQVVQGCIDVLAEGLFLAAKRKGERSGYDTFLVIDEAHNFVSDDPTHITSIISKEARKFGMGMVLASQSLSHFPEDIIGNAATKVILGIDEMYHEQTAKKLRIEAKRLGWIVPKKSALIQIKTGDMANRYLDVMLH